MVEKRNLDNPAMRNFLASAVGCVIVLAVAIKAINTSFDWAVVVGLFGAAVLASCSIYYGAVAFGWQPAGEQVEWVEEEEEELVQSATEPPKDLSKCLVKFDAEEQRFYTRMSSFLARALKTNIYQARKDLEISQYEWEQFTRIFDEAQVTINNGTKAREFNPEVIKGGTSAAWARLNRVMECDIPASLEVSMNWSAPGRAYPFDNGSSEKN